MAQLFFRYGAMNSGKTIEILKVAHNYEEQNKSVIIMTSGIDDRDSVGYVSSRIGMKRKAVPVFDEDDLYEKGRFDQSRRIVRAGGRSPVSVETPCIGIDESR